MSVGLLFMAIPVMFLVGGYSFSAGFAWWQAFAIGALSAAAFMLLYAVLDNLLAAWRRGRATSSPRITITREAPSRKRA